MATSSSRLTALGRGLGLHMSFWASPSFSSSSPTFSRLDLQIFEAELPPVGAGAKPRSRAEVPKRLRAGAVLEMEVPRPSRAPFLVCRCQALPRAVLCAGTEAAAPLHPHVSTELPMCDPTALPGSKGLEEKLAQTRSVKWGQVKGIWASQNFGQHPQALCCL